jgi:sensor histidine kinase YesM
MKIDDIRLKLVKRIKYMSIKTKIIVAVLAATIAFLLATILITYSLVSDTIQEKVLTNLTTLNHQYAINVDNKTKELKSTSYNLLATEEVSELLINGDTGSINENDILESVCSRYLLANKYITYISVMDLEGNVYLWNNSQMGMNMSTAELVMKNAKNELELFDTDYKWVEDIWGKEHMTTFMKSVVDAKTLKTIGYAVITVDDNYFVEGLGVLDQGHHMLIYNRFDELVLVNGEFIEDVQSFSYVEDQKIYYSNSGVYMDKETVKSANWTTNLMVERDYMYEDLDNLKFIFILIFFAVSVLISLLLSFFVSRLTRDLRVFEKSMRKIEEGDFSTRIKPRTYDEVGLLSLRFNYMSSRIDTLVNEVYLQQLQRQKKEFEVLQAQINPHFLYNTLGTMKWNAHINDNAEMEAYVDAFIELLKLTAKSDNEYITISQEISYIKNYVTLQKYRFDEMFQVEYKIDETLLNESVLKFILQPLVENCIFHAFSYKDTNGMIRILIKDCGEEMCLTVEDNGKGMSKEQVATLFHDESDHSKKGLTSIGVKNVNERLQLYYGEEYGLKIHSEEGQYTRIEIVVPKIKEE